MTASNHGVAALAYFLAAIGFAAFTAQLRLGWRGGKRGGWLLTAISLSACWTIAEATYAYTGSPGVRITANLLDTLRIWSWFGFLLALLYPGNHSDNQGRERLSIWAHIGMGLLALFLFALQSSPLLAGSILGKGSRGAFLCSLAFAIVGLTLVEQVFRNISAHARWGIKPLCLGLGGAFCFDLYYFSESFLFNQLNLELWASRGIVNLLIVPLIAVSAARNKDWALEISVSRHVVFHSTTLLISGVYLLGIAAAGYYVRYFGSNWGGALQVIFLFAGLLSFSIIYFSGSLRSKLRVLLNKHFFNYRYDYREEWLHFTQALSSGDTPLGLLEHAISALADLVESPGGMVWLAESTGDLCQAARMNMPEIKDVEPQGGALVRFLARTNWVVNLTDYTEKPEKYDGLTLPRWLESLTDAWLLVPLYTTHGLMGFAILARSRARVDVNWEVIDLLKTAARQAASYIAYMRATEAILESKKFDTFSRMSAFVVHDIKNLVTQLSLLMKNAEKHKENREFQADMLITIDNVVVRMKKLLLQLRTGEQAGDAQSLVHLNSIVERIANAKVGQSPALTIEVGDDATVLAHADRLERVIGHLVQNAIDATPADGKVWLKLLSDSGRAIVEVGDTGHGMSQEFIRNGMFRPFTTTKATGMGIGAYESALYIKGLGGRITVDSKENGGTVVRVELQASDQKTNEV